MSIGTGDPNLVRASGVALLGALDHEGFGARRSRTKRACGPRPARATKEWRIPASLRELILVWPLFSVARSCRRRRWLHFEGAPTTRHVSTPRSISSYIRVSLGGARDLTSGARAPIIMPDDGPAKLLRFASLPARIAARSKSVDDSHGRPARGSKRVRADTQSAGDV